MYETIRTQTWELNSELNDNELLLVKETASALLKTIKKQQLSRYQAVQALELLKIAVDDEPIS